MILCCIILCFPGGKWYPIRAPLHDATGERYHCADTGSCTLHLHGIADLYGPFYSSQNAIGLVMGTGSVGRWLLDGTDSVNTYYSHDGGVTWQEVAKGSHIYEFGDHGSLTIMAPDTKATDRVLYVFLVLSR